MKKVLIFLSLLFVVIIVESCDNAELTPNPSESVNLSDNKKNDSIDKKDSSVVGKDMFMSLKEDIKELKRTDSLRESNLGSLQSQQDDLELKVAKLEKEKIGLKEMVIALFVVSLVLLFAIFFLMRKLYISREQVKDYVNGKLKTYVKFNDVENSFNHYSNQISTNRIKIQELEARCSKLEKKGAQSAAVVNTNAASNVGNFQKNVISEQNVKSRPGEFYMKPAIEEGVFDGLLKSMVKTEDTYFTFTLDRHNQNKASFKFDPYDDSRVMYALKYREEILGMACEIEGNCDSGSAQFRQIEGEAEWKDGKWKVIRKAIVIFK